MSNALGTMLPLISSVVGPAVSKAVSGGGIEPLTGGLGGLDAQVLLAEAALKNPAFVAGPPPIDPQLVAVVAMLGLLGGWMVSESMK